MRSKLDQLRTLWENGDRLGALRIASKYFDRSPATKTMKRGWDAYSNPSFYRQINRDPEALVGEAMRVMATKFGLPD